jgi:G3E family GTPase
MPGKTPLTLINGPLGAGKTTLLRHMVCSSGLRLALVINEFGELGIDARVMAGENIQISELDGGCVCCSLLGEFEAAIHELVDTVKPEAIVVETTGVAEPEALLFDVAEELPRVRIDGVITVADADATLGFPEMSPTMRMQTEVADLILLNKADLVSEEQLSALQQRLQAINRRSPVIATRHCHVDVDLLFGIGHSPRLRSASHLHQLEYESITYYPGHSIRRDCFEHVLGQLDPSVYRAKGFAVIDGETHLINYVNGRWQLESWSIDQYGLVFIGKGIKRYESQIVSNLKTCENPF